MLVGLIATAIGVLTTTCIFILAQYKEEIYKTIIFGDEDDL